MIGISVEETEQSIKKLEYNKIIVRYISVRPWTKIEDHPGVRAMIRCESNTKTWRWI